MNESALEIMAPKVLKRPRGGFLAVSGPLAPVRLGAMADTEGDAVAQYNELVSSWARDRAAEQAEH
jgi:hypothetical protein